MIYVTVGTSEFQFNRLFQILDELCDENFLRGEDIIAQTGKSDYIIRNYKSFSLIDDAKHKEFIKQSSFMITHSGTGSIISSLKMGKKIIVFPRLKEYGEHVDNHQLELCKVFVSKGYVLEAQNKEEMKKKIREIVSFQPNKFISNNKNINHLIINVLEEFNKK